MSNSMSKPNAVNMPQAGAGQPDTAAQPTAAQPTAEQLTARHLRADGALGTGEPFFDFGKISIAAGKVSHGYRVAVPLWRLLANTGSYSWPWRRCLAVFFGPRRDPEKMALPLQSRKER